IISSEVVSNSDSSVHQELVEEKTDWVSILSAVFSTSLMTDYVPPTMSFSDMEVDSLLSLELRNKIQKLAKITLSPNILYQYDNIQELANYLESIQPSSKRRTSDRNLRKSTSKLKKLSSRQGSSNFVTENSIERVFTDTDESYLMNYNQMAVYL